jgi:hypothetical protein
MIKNEIFDFETFLAVKKNLEKYEIQSEMKKKER